LMGIIITRLSVHSFIGVIIIQFFFAS
jgi:hypothetical protein